MRITNTNNVSFKGKIVDSHFHDGCWWVNADKDTPNAVKNGSGYSLLKQFSASDTLEILNRPINGGEDSLDKIYVSSLDCLVRKSPILSENAPFLKDEILGNKELFNKYKNQPKVLLYAVCQPGYGSAENIEKIFDSFKDGFVGLKFHPVQLNIQADDSKYYPYMEFAGKKKLPCLFHSGSAIDWVQKEGGEVVGELVSDKTAWDKSDPRFIYNLAKKYPDVPVILGHTGAGGEPAHRVAMKVLFSSLDENDAKLYADISWMDFTPDGKPSDEPKNLIELIKGLKKRNALDRILFGTDAPLGCYGQNASDGNSVHAAYSETIAKLKKVIKNNFPNEAEEILDKIFHKNAETLFGKALKDSAPKIAPENEGGGKLPHSKAGKFIAGIGIAICAIGAIYCSLKQKNDKGKSV